MAFAHGDKAWGHCDRCGFRYLLKELRKEWTHLLVCRDCFDPEPQELKRNARSKIYDPQALRNPRPDKDDVDAPESQLSDVVDMTPGNHASEDA